MVIHNKFNKYYIKHHRNIRIVGLSSSFVFISLLTLSIFPIVSHQEEVVASPGDDPNALTHLNITTSEQTASVDLIPISSNGTFATSDDTTIVSNNTIDFSVDTTNYTGYNLSLKARADDTTPNLLTNSAASDSLTSITTAISEADFSDSTAAGASYNGQWGFKPSKFCSDPTDITTCNNNTSYLPAPTTAGTLLDTTTSANTTANNYTIAIGARADYTKPSGTYTNTYELIAIANPVAYAIEYWNVNNVNDADITWYVDGSNTAKKATFVKIGQQASATTTNTTITLNPTYTSGSAPTRNTYTFAGWCRNSTNHTQPGVNETVVAVQNSSNKVTAYNNPATMCNGTVPDYNTSTDDFIKAGDTTFKLDPTKDSTNIKLYAVWKPTTFAIAGIAANANMQTMTSTICSKVTPNQFTTMRDSRDNGANTYVIIKLMDGKCWMADNLNFDAYTYKSNVTTATTHATGTVGSTALNVFKNGGTRPGDRYATSAINSTNSTSGNWTASWSYSDPLINKSGTCQATRYICLYPYQKKTSGSPTYSGNYTSSTVISLYGTTWDSTTGEGTANITYNFGPGGYKVGTYYNYCAVTVGAYCYGNGTSGGTSSGNATEADICPYNWKLPVGGASGDFQNLYNKIGLITTSPAAPTNLLSFQAMLSTPVSGNYDGGSAYRQGTYGYLWSSTYSSATGMSFASVSGTVVNPQNVSSRFIGQPVRCITQS